MYRRIFLDLLEKVVSYEIPNAEWLPRLDDISARYACSETVAREAVRALVERGIVDVQPGRGHQVNDSAFWNVLDGDVATAILIDHPTSEMVHDAIEAVTRVQTQAAMLAAERSLSGDMKMLDGWILQMEEAVSGQDTVSEADDPFAEAEALFNGLVTRLSANRFLVSMLTTLHPVLATARRDRAPEHDQDVIRLSATIAAGLSANDPTATAAAVESWGRRLGSWLKV